MDEYMTSEERSIIIPNLTAKTNSKNIDLQKDHTMGTSRDGINHEGLIKVKKPKVTFQSGSNYEGEWNVSGMSGEGIYRMFNDVYYEGVMKDGIFHGEGTIWYPNCSRFQGVWNNGDLQHCDSYIYKDNLEYKSKDWSYCSGEDRRFWQEIIHGINPTGRTQLSADIPPKRIPPGFYDTGDGYYNPLAKCVYNSHGEIIRIPGKSEEEVILNNYRRSPGKPSYKFPGIQFPVSDSEWLETEEKETEEEIEEKVTEEKLFSLDKLFIKSGSEEKIDSVKENSLFTEIGDSVIETHKIVVDKSVGRYSFLELEGEGNQYKIIDETQPLESTSVSLPTMKVDDTKIELNKNFINTEPKEGIDRRKEVLGNKLALLMRVLRKVEEVGGPHNLTGEDCEAFKKQLAIEVLRMKYYDNIEFASSLLNAIIDGMELQESSLCSSVLGTSTSLKEKRIKTLNKEDYKDTYNIVTDIVQDIICNIFIQRDSYHSSDHREADAECPRSILLAVHCEKDLHEDNEETWSQS